MSTIEFDALGVFPEVVTNGVGHETRTVYSYRHGGLRRTVEPGGVTTDVSYDHFGRPTESVRLSTIGGASSGVVESTRYERISAGPTTDPSRMRIVQSIPGHSYGATEFDRMERRVKRSWFDVEGNTIVQRETYSPAGLPVRSELPHRIENAAPGSTVIQYDALLRTRVETAPDGAQIVTTYPVPGERIVTDAVGRQTRFISDVEDQVVRTEDNNSTPTCFVYGPFGTLTEIRRGCTSNTNHWTTAGYDSYGRRTSSTDPNQGSRSFEYDGFGLLRSTVEESGARTDFLYDAIGRLVQRDDADGRTEWTWDRDFGGGFLGYVGKIRSSVSADGIEHRYDHDMFGRLTASHQTVGSTTLTTRYGYDALGRETRVEHPSSFGVPFVVENDFDDWGNLIAVTNASNPNSKQLLWAQHASHPSGMVAEEQYGNGLTTWRTYDPLALTPDTIVTSDDEGEFDVQGLTYEYNADRTLHSRGDAVIGQLETFQYDDIGQLTRSVATKGAAMRAISQTYDPFGNIQTRTGAGAYKYDDPKRPDRATSIDGKTVTYDSNGNLKSLGDVLSIEYTAFDIPRRVTAAGVVTTHAYDAEGFRAKRTSSADNSTTLYAEDYEVRSVGLLASREHRYSVRALGRTVAEVVRSNFVEAGAPGPLGFVERTRYFHDDHLGSPDVVTEANATIAQRLSFEGFGRARQSTWTAGGVPTPPVSPVVGFIGLPNDPDTGLVKMQGRWYHPTLGRFLSPDPFTADPWTPVGQNRYAYAWNRPLSVTDRTGFAPPAGDVGGDPGGPPPVTRTVIVRGETLAGMWCDAFIEWTHSLQSPTSTPEGFGYSLRVVIEAWQGEPGVIGGLGAAGRAAAGGVWFSV